jgi:putative cell wall-binding protein
LLALAAALITSVQPALASPLPHAHKAAVPVMRIHGVDRYDQAVQVSRAKREADLVYLASGEKFADALSASAVAGAHRSPLLLTPRDSIPQGVVDELVRLQAKSIVIVGGPASVSDAVMSTISQSVTGATVTRVGGADRYEVSRNLIQDATVGIPRAELLFVATGATFPDALTASPAAVHAGQQPPILSSGAPVLLVNGAQTAPSGPESQLLASTGTTTIRIVGGTNSVSASFEASLAGFDVSRIAGADRFEVGAGINQNTFASASKVYLSSGVAFPDALSGGPLAASKSSPLYVVQTNCVPAAVLGEIGRLGPSSVVILGGPNTLGPGVESLTPC